MVQFGRHQAEEAVILTRRAPKTRTHPVAYLSVRLCAWGCRRADFPSP